MAMAQPLWNQEKKIVSFIGYALYLQESKCTFISLSTKTQTATDTNAFGVEHAPANGNANVKTVCKQRRSKEALDMDVLYANDQRGGRTDSNTYASLLQGCLDRKALAEGKLIHAHMMDTGFKLDMLVATKLVMLYAKCGSLLDARNLFDEMPERNEALWTTMIAAHARHGLGEEALVLFYQMQQTGIQPDQFAFSSVLPACGNLGALKHGKEFHEAIITRGFMSDVFVGSSLVEMYVKCGNIIDARQVFEEMSERNVISWTSMIAGYAQNGHLDEAMKLFEKMPRRDLISWNVMIAGYAKNGRLDEARNLFQRMPERNVVSWTAMISGYAQNGRPDVAFELFLEMPEPNSVSWTAMIAGYAQNGHVDEALKLFKKMPKPDPVTWNVMITGYAQIGHVDNALKLFQEMPRRDLVSWNTLIAGYAQSDHIEEALKLFEKMPERNMVSWNTMIAAYAQCRYVDGALNLFQKMPRRNVVSWNTVIAGFVQNGRFDETLNLFQQMQTTGMKPDSVTFASVLPACANLAALQQGKDIHEDIIRNGLQSNVFVGSALVDMYAKCGCIQNARNVFDKMPERNVVTWNAMIVGYAMHGCGVEAIQLFQQMQCSCTKPDNVTFVGVLSACCHAGLVDDGKQFFDCMSREYHITPVVEHYCCMVDLLGRSGHLHEALDFINKMPIKPDAAVWGSFLGACRIHGNLELGEQVAEHLFELDPQNSAHYVLLSNIYGAAGKWDDKEKVRTRMKDRKVQKTPGCSWIEVNNKVYHFLTGDRSPPQMQEIYAKLERLSGQMKEEGYAPDTNFVLHDVEDEQKEHILSYHSEKLAIAFGLINTSPRSTIRIVKNLRVCGDCHSATKLISKILSREIIVRDASRFHHFKDGRCSCQDYW